eukprot:Hpha_TRINITY_DN15310_c0_g3::TRINITY_DN15310_c0_g3_i1::g.91298::m.91298
MSKARPRGMSGLSPGPRLSAVVGTVVSLGGAFVLLTGQQQHLPSNTGNGSTSTAPPSDVPAPSTNPARRVPPPGAWWRCGGERSGGGRWEVDAAGLPQMKGAPSAGDKDGVERELDGLRRCVKGKHWVFVGDSVLRYMWMTLVGMIDGKAGMVLEEVAREANQFLSQYGTVEPDAAVAGAAKRGGQSSLLWQKEWPTWGAFVSGSTARFEGRMCCDCFRCNMPDPTISRRKRLSSRGMRAKREGFWLTQRENRFYHGEGWNASFFFLHGDTGGYGDTPVWTDGCPHRFGHRNSTLAPATHAQASACATCPCPPQWPPREEWKEKWRGKVTELVNAVKEQGGADVIVANGGLWKPAWPKDKVAGLAAVKATEG